MIGELTKEFEFPAGHRLMTYEGDCKNCHGHNYKLVVGVRGIADERTGIIIDFKELKQVVNNIIKPLDHAMILNGADIDFISFFTSKGQKVFTFPGEPTAENISAFLYHALQDEGLRIIKFVELYETSTSKVRYEGGD